jgi:DNA-binding beta-propeller fold protein YncE
MAISDLNAEEAINPGAVGNVGQPTTEDQEQSGEEKDQRKRRLYLLLLLFLLLICCCLSYFIIRYLLKPQPLPQMVPVVNNVINYPPTYKFTITGVDKPVGVAVSPDNQLIYVAESAGDRLVKVFNRDGQLIDTFAPPGTDRANREPKYIAVDGAGHVYLVDRTSNAIDIFAADGTPLDAIIGQDLTVSKLLTQQLHLSSGMPTGTTFHYEGINRILFYTLPGQTQQSIKVPPSDSMWAPLGVRFDAQGDLLYTDFTPDHHTLNMIPAADIHGSLASFHPQIKTFGAEGSDPGTVEFPQTLVTDSKGNYYVSDGNNARISVFKPDGTYSTFFGFGSGESGLNLPRGMWMDNKDHLHVADAVGSLIRVYDVSGSEPSFLYNFGGYGVAEGQFSYPFDICIDGSGRLYVADRENNRIDVWSY